MAAFQPGSVIVYHRNAASDGLYLNSTLAQQGLESLVATTPDHWQVRRAVVRGVGGRREGCMWGRWRV